MIDWRHWHNEPYLVGGLIVLGWLYAILTGPLRNRLAPEGTPFPRRQAVKFYAALLVFYLAVGSPLDEIAERFLFSAHMLQHQLLSYPAAILFLLGLPDWLVDPLLGRPAFRRIGRVLFHPLILGLEYVVVTSVWHAPMLYEWALQNKAVHIVEHLMFFGVSLSYWWSQLSPSQVFPRISHAGQMLFQVGILIGMTPVFAYVTFSPDILYATYEYAPRLIAGFTPANDQLLAGVMMKLGGMLVALTAVGVSFFNWYRAGLRPENT